jgi:hypothetical protein
MSFYGTYTLDYYLSVYIVEYFVIASLNSPLNFKAQKFTNILGYAMFAVFIFIVAVKIFGLLGGSCL